MHPPQLRPYLRPSGDWIFHSPTLRQQPSTSARRHTVLPMPSAALQTPSVVRSRSLACLRRASGGRPPAQPCAAPARPPLHHTHQSSEAHACDTHLVAPVQEHPLEQPTPFICTRRLPMTHRGLPQGQADKEPGTHHPVAPFLRTPHLPQALRPLTAAAAAFMTSISPAATSSASSPSSGGDTSAAAALPSLRLLAPSPDTRGARCFLQRAHGQEQALRLDIQEATRCSTMHDNTHHAHYLQLHARSHSASMRTRQFIERTLSSTHR